MSTIWPNSVKNTALADNRAVLLRVKKGVIIIEDKYIGKIYGCYEIISRTNQRTKDRHIIYNCRCVHCGTEKQMKLSNIKYNKRTMCTHYIIIGSIAIPNIIEDKSIPNKRIKKIFLNLVHRCYDISDKDYRFYGEKGIGIYKKWVENPNEFYQWAIANGYDDKLTIDRINEEKDYSPDNCRWITRSENARFESNTNYITATITLSGRQWADLIPEHGVNYINKMIREQGKEKTVKYIEDRFLDKHNLLDNE